MYPYTYIYIYMYISAGAPVVAGEAARADGAADQVECLLRSTANLPTDIVGFRGFHSSIILI